MAEPGTPAFIAQYNFARAIRAGNSYGGPGSPRITGQQLSDAAQTNTSEYLRLVSIQAAQEIYKGNPGAGPHYALSAQAQKDREEAQRYAQLSAGYGFTTTQPTTPPPLPWQQQQAPNPGLPWSTRVQTYGDYLAGVKSWWTDTPEQKLKRANGRRLAIAYIGPEPVPVKAGPYKSPLQVAEEARLAQQARDRETARMDSIGRAAAAAKDPTGASNAAFAQQIAAFANAPALPPPAPKPVDNKTADYLNNSAVAAFLQAIANGAVLASIVKKAPPKKNQPGKPKGTTIPGKKPISKLKK